MRAAFGMICSGALALAIASCSGGADQASSRPDDAQDGAKAPASAASDGAHKSNDAPAATAANGTPMKDRVAEIGVLNKRNNLTRTFEMKPGDAREFGNVLVQLEACEKTPPWELPQEEGAFVQVSVRESARNQFEQIFSGWLFKNSPSLNVVEHPIYDVWVKHCKMSFPGEE